MNNYKYYTPIELAECLIKLLPTNNYKSIIDICCGSWNLLKAAQKVHPDAKYIGVDIDTNAVIHKIDNSLFINRDGRKFAILQSKKGQVYDLILSNPPFGYLEEDKRIFKNVKVQYKGLNNKRYENEMTQANFMLAHENSVLIFILPNTFVEGVTNIKARKEIAKDYQINTIIKLPDNTFGSSKISTYAIIMVKNNYKRENTRFYNAFFDNTWKINFTNYIPYEKIIEGNWVNESKLKEAKVFMYRGNISSRFFSKNGETVLHCSNMIIGDNWMPSIKYCSTESGKKYRVAKKDDILINRIGKYAGYWTINKLDNVIVSDCIIVITKHDKKVLNALEKNSVNGRMKVPLRGVSTKYVTAMDIISLLT